MCSQRHSSDLCEQGFDTSSSLHVYLWTIYFEKQWLSTCKNQALAGEKLMVQSWVNDKSGFLTIRALLGSPSFRCKGPHDASRDCLLAAESARHLDPDLPSPSILIPFYVQVMTVATGYHLQETKHFILECQYLPLPFKSKEGTRGANFARNKPTDHQRLCQICISGPFLARQI